MWQAKEINKLYNYREMMIDLFEANDNFAPLLVWVEDQIETGETYLTAKRTGDVIARARAIAGRR